MTIEIRQLSIRTTVVETLDEKKTEAPRPAYDMDALRQKLLEECRQLVTDIIETRQER